MKARPIPEGSRCQEQVSNRQHQPVLGQAPTFGNAKPRWPYASAHKNSQQSRPQQTEMVHRSPQCYAVRSFERLKSPPTRYLLAMLELIHATGPAASNELVP